MSEEFKAIETQEAFDAAIKARIERNTRSVTDSVTAEITKKYEGWISPEDAKKSADRIAELTQQVETANGQITELTAKNQAAALDALRTRIAHESGLPYELAARLSGTTEEELKKDAETLAALVAGKHQPHRFDSERGGGLSGVEAAFYAKNPGLKPN